MANNNNQLEETKRLYVQGKLTAEEIEEFEIYILDKPELLEELELDMALKQHLPAVSLEQRPARPKWYEWLLQPLVTSFVTCVICVVSFVGFLQLSDHEQGFEGSGKVNLVYLAPLRDSSEQADNKLSLAKGDEQLTVVLQPTVMAVTAFNVKVLNPQNKQVLAFENVDIQGMGDVVVAVPSKLLTPGEWVFEVSPVGENESVEKLLLEITD